jgi:lipoprotein-anchoring transpeptidase ErfK/SrfK
VNQRRLGALLVVVPLIPVLLWSPVRRLVWSEPPIRLEVSLSARQMKVIENGRVVRSYGIAVGQPAHPTPKGHFQTGAIEWNPSWTPPPSRWARNKRYQPPGAASNPMQGVKIYFRAPYYFIHGTNNPSSIGSAASHGCIRMTESEAVELARLISEAGRSVPLVIRS